MIIQFFVLDYVTGFLAGHYSSVQIKDDEMVGVCITCDGKVRYMQGFCGKNIKGRDHLEYLVVDGMILLT